MKYIIYVFQNSCVWVYYFFKRLLGVMNSDQIQSNFSTIDEKVRHVASLFSKKKRPRVTGIRWIALKFMNIACEYEICNLLALKSLLKFSYKSPYLAEVLMVTKQRFPTSSQHSELEYVIFRQFCLLSHLFPDILLIGK